jgi:hypothetical protein
MTLAEQIRELHEYDGPDMRDSAAQITEDMCNALRARLRVAAAALRAGDARLAATVIDDAIDLL